MRTDFTGKAQQHECFLYGHRFDRHLGPQTGHLGFATGFHIALRCQLGVTELNVGAKTSRLQIDGFVRFRIDAEFLVSLLGVLQQSDRTFHIQFIGCDVVGHGGP